MAAHQAVRRGEVCPACIIEGSSGAQHGLLANHAGAAHFLDMAVAVCDVPVAVEKLHRARALVFDAHLITPRKEVLLRAGFLGEVFRRHRDADAMRGFGIVRHKGSVV